MRSPVLTPENVRVERAKYWGWNVIYPASRRGRTFYSHWCRTKAEAESYRLEVLHSSEQKGSS